MNHAIQSEFFARNPTLIPMYELLSSQPGAYFYIKDQQFRYVRANRASLSTYGLTEESELIGKRSSDFLPPVLANAYEAEDERLFTTGKPILNETWLVPHVRGTPRWFTSSKTPIYDQENRHIVGLVGLMFRIATPEAQRVRFQELQRVIDFVESHYVGELTAAKLAEIAGHSVTHFNRRFRELLRMSPMAYVESLRIQHAQRLLTTTDQTLGAISADTGFFDQSHFTKRFRKTVGMTPLAYRKRYRG